MADDKPDTTDSAVKNEQTGNKFANDGSFLELFKRKMAEQNALKSKETDDDSGKDENSEKPSQSDDSVKVEKTNISSLVGKRRSGGSAKTLQTGIVKKPKQDADDEAGSGKDGWSKYMAEVNKYKAQICTDEDKTRPLVK